MLSGGRAPEAGAQQEAAPGRSADAQHGPQCGPGRAPAVAADRGRRPDRPPGDRHRHPGPPATVDDQCPADQGERAVDPTDQAAPVGGHHDGPALEPRPEQLGQRRLAVGVEMGRRLVQQHQRCVTQHGPAEGDALALTGAQREAALADRGLEPWGSRADSPPARTVRRPGRAPRVGLGVAEAEVVGDGPADQVRALGHPGDLPSPRREVSTRRRSTPPDRDTPRPARRSRAGRRAAWTCPTPTPRSRPGARRVQWRGPRRRAPGSRARGSGRVTPASRSGSTPTVGERRRSRRVRRRPVARRRRSLSSRMSRMRSAAACPSALAWNSAPARRSGR